MDTERRRDRTITPPSAAIVPYHLYAFDELVSCHNNIVDTMAYENFRTGFQLGTMMVMEAVSENEAVLFAL